MSAEVSAGALAGIDAVTFDLDDTFWDCAPAIERAEARLSAWLDEHAPQAAAAHRDGELLAHRMRLLDQQPELVGDVSELRKRSLAELFRRLDAEHALSEEAYRVFYRARSEVVLYDGVVPLLEQLGGHYRVAAITNGNADLEQIGIRALFEQVLVATLDSPAKPHRFMFDAAAEHLGVAHRRLLHVGDNVVTDVQGAMDAGCQACWFNQSGSAWPGPAAAPHHEVDSISALRTLLLGNGSAA